MRHQKIVIMFYSEINNSVVNNLRSVILRKDILL